MTVNIDEKSVFNDRITSYNVCYTKLLRQPSEPGGPAGTYIDMMRYDVSTMVGVITSYSIHYTKLYEVSPIFPGVTTRRVNIFGRRITRIKTSRDYETVQAAHFEFRPRPVEEPQMATA